jgi:CDGSH iron-sulfur domain-containing protein 3
MAVAAPKIAQRGPYSIVVEAGRAYWWCACGRSASQPFCDGSHKGSGFVPVEYKPDAAATVAFCGCKRTGTAPRCDGSHSRLAEPAA